MAEREVARSSSPSKEMSSPTSSSIPSPRTATTSTIFVGEGTPRQSLLVTGARSPLSDAFSNADPTPPPNAISGVTFSNLPSYAADPMDALTSLELRIRWLEALTSGAGVYNTGSGTSSSKDKSKDDEHSRRVGLLRKASEVQHQLDQIVTENDQLRRFMSTCKSCYLLYFLVHKLMKHPSHLTTSRLPTLSNSKDDEYEHILNPSFALSPTSTSSSSHNLPSSLHLTSSSPFVPSYEDLTEAELEVFLKDMEPDIRGADRDLREVQALDKRGVTGAGKLLDHEALKPRLDALIEAYQEDEATYTRLESRMGDLLQRYSAHVNALSELFVHWNSDVQAAEYNVARLEREKRQRDATQIR